MFEAGIATDVVVGTHDDDIVVIDGVVDAVVVFGVGYVVVDDVDDDGLVVVNVTVGVVVYVTVGVVVNVTVGAVVVLSNFLSNQVYANFLHSSTRRKLSRFISRKFISISN